MKIRQLELMIALMVLSGQGLLAQDATGTGSDSTDHPIVFETDFQEPDSNWTMTDAEAWRFSDRGTLELFRKASQYKPPFRSPGHIALLNEPVVSDFVLDVRVLSTHEDYGHRDVCLFFGHQSPSQFYYVHLGKKTDPHANQIFIVNNAARTRISLTTTEGTDWDENWHQVRIQRNCETGNIRVFFDDMTTPAMTAVDSTFAWGKIGLGSFDDTAEFDELAIRGLVKQDPAGK